MINRSGINQSFVEKSNFSLNKKEELSNKIITQQKHIEQLRLSLTELSYPISQLEGTQDRASLRAESCYNKVNSRLLHLKQDLENIISSIKVEISQQEQETSVLENKLKTLKQEIVELKDSIKSNKTDHIERAKDTRDIEKSLVALTEETNTITNTINQNNTRLGTLQEKKNGFLRILGYCALCLTFVGIIFVINLEKSRSAENKTINDTKQALTTANQQLTNRKTEILEKLAPEATQALQFSREMEADAVTAGVKLDKKLSSLINIQEQMMSSIKKLDSIMLQPKFERLTALEEIISAEVDLEILANNLKHAIADHSNISKELSSQLTSLQTEIDNVLEANTSSSNVAQELQEKRNEETAIGEKIIAAEDELVEMKKAMLELEDKILLDRALFESGSESDKSEKRDYELEREWIYH